MVKVQYDLIDLPITKKVLLWDAGFYVNESVSPPTLEGLYCEDYTLSLKNPADGNLIIGDFETGTSLFYNRIPPDPGSGAYNIFNFTCMENALVGIYWGKSSANYDTPIFVAINRSIKALLIYNPTSYSIIVNHPLSEYPNYETDGVYDGVNHRVTLSTDNYVIFYNSTKPTINSSAKWGYTDYEPKSSTTQPSGYYLDAYYGYTHYYWINTIDVSLYSDVNAVTGGTDRYKLWCSDYVQLNCTYQYNYRSGYRSDECFCIDEKQPARQFSIYADDPNTTSWAGGIHTCKIVYIKDNTGIMLIQRNLKVTTNRTFKWHGIFGYKYILSGSKKRIKAIVYVKAIVDCLSYGYSNQVSHPSPINIMNSTSSTNVQYWNGTSWATDSPPNQSAYSYYANVYIARGYTNTININNVGAIICVRRWGGYDNPTPYLAVGFTGFRLFIDYSGATIPAGNYVWGTGEAVIDPTGTLPDLSDISPYEHPVTKDTENYTLRYGYPYEITNISAPSSASAGSTVNVTVTTNAPDGTLAYLVDKYDNTILDSDTVSGGSVTLSFTMPNRDVELRAYVIGTDVQQV
jgi:hypothetical protein